MPADNEHISLLIALDAALLLILAGLAKKQLAWKRAAPEPISPRLHQGKRRIVIGAICLGAAGAAAAALAGAVTPAAALAYIAAAIVAVFATR